MRMSTFGIAACSTKAGLVEVGMMPCVRVVTQGSLTMAIFCSSKFVGGESRIAQAQEIMMQGNADQIKALAETGQLVVGTVGAGDLLYLPAACITTYRVLALDVLGVRAGVLSHDLLPRLTSFFEACVNELPPAAAKPLAAAVTELQRPAYKCAAAEAAEIQRRSKEEEGGEAAAKVKADAEAAAAAKADADAAAAAAAAQKAEDDAAAKRKADAEEAAKAEAEADAAAAAAAQKANEDAAAKAAKAKASCAKGERTSSGRGRRRQQEAAARSKRLGVRKF